MDETHERGSALPLLALVILLAGGAAVVLGRSGGAALDRARARTTADAAALAGAAEGRDAAVAVAAADGGRLTAYEELGDDRRVTVVVGRARAVARARPHHGAAGRGAAASTGGLAPAMRAALDRAEQLLGVPVPITSG